MGDREEEIESSDVTLSSVLDNELGEDGVDDKLVLGNASSVRERDLGRILDSFNFLLGEDSKSSSSSSSSSIFFFTVGRRLGLRFTFSTSFKVCTGPRERGEG